MFGIILLLLPVHTTDCNSSSSFQSKTVFQPHRGDFKTLFEVFSFLLPMGFTDGDPR